MNHKERVKREFNELLQDIRTTERYNVTHLGGVKMDKCDMKNWKFLFGIDWSKKLREDMTKIRIQELMLAGYNMVKYVDKYAEIKTELKIEWIKYCKDNGYTTSHQRYYREHREEIIARVKRYYRRHKKECATQQRQRRIIRRERREIPRTIRLRYNITWGGQHDYCEEGRYIEEIPYVTYEELLRDFRGTRRSRRGRQQQRRCEGIGEDGICRVLGGYGHSSMCGHNGRCERCGHNRTNVEGLQIRIENIPRKKRKIIELMKSGYNTSRYHYVYRYDIPDEKEVCI